MPVLKGQDIVVLLKLLDLKELLPVRNLAAQLGFDPAGTHRAIRRLEDARLYSAGRGRVYAAAAEEFLIHAVKFIFPARRGPEGRGIPTSWGAEPLRSELADLGGLPPVWPHVQGSVRGLVLEPLHPMAPDAALSDPQLWERLALVDALRSNEGARMSELAARLLRERIMQ